MNSRGSTRKTRRGVDGSLKDYFNLLVKYWDRGGVWFDDDSDRDDGPDPCGIAAGLPQNSSTGCKDQTGRKGSGSDITCTDREAHLSLSTELQQKKHPVPGTGFRVSEWVGAKSVMLEPIP